MKVSELRECLRKLKSDAEIFYVTHESRQNGGALDGAIESMRLEEVSPSRNSIELILETRPLSFSRNENPTSQQRDNDTVA